MTLWEQIANTVFEHETTAGVDHKGAADSILDLLRENITLEWGEDDGVFFAKSILGEYNYTKADALVDGGFLLFLGDMEVASENYVLDDDVRRAALEHYRNTIITALGG